MVRILLDIQRHVGKAEALTHTRRPSEEHGEADVCFVYPGEDTLAELSQEKGLVLPLLEGLMQPVCEQSAGCVIKPSPGLEAYKNGASDRVFSTRTRSLATYFGHRRKQRRAGSSQTGRSWIHHSACLRNRKMRCTCCSNGPNSSSEPVAPHPSCRQHAVHEFQ